MAVTLVAREDARLVADIEKLIKKKIELEPLELDSERPRREPRERSSESRGAYAGRREEASPRPSAPPRRAPPAAPRDPFFDKPYEPSGNTAAAETEPAALAVSAGRSLSPNIKPKKKVAALFGAKRNGENQPS